MAGSQLFLRLLGQELRRARDAREIDQRDAADQVHLTGTQLSRIEKGRSMPKGLYVTTLCAYYGLNAKDTKSMTRLFELASKPPWWTHLGPRPESTEGLLWLEAAAWSIRVYELYSIPGLLQTAAMAEAINKAVDIGISENQQETGVDLRMQRQDKVWGREEPPKMICVIDEAALLRLPGRPEVRRAQISRLIDPPPTVSVHVLPFYAGPTPSTGAYNVFSIDLGSSEPTRAVHVDGSTVGQATIVESEEQVRPFELAFEGTFRAALSQEDSARVLYKKMEEIQDD